MTTSSTSITHPQAASGDNWLSTLAEDPMGSVIWASVAVIASFGLVLSGIWLIHAGLQ